MKSSLFVKILREKKLLLPPLSRYTDYPFRAILKKFLPPFITTEMANARAVVQKNRRTMQILKIAEGNHYNGVQLVGSIPEYMRKAAVIVQDLGFDYIDINMGCTVRKVAGRGEGIALMNHEERARQIVTAIVEAVNVPVTCKMRLGASQYSINVMSFSKKLVDAGIVALTIHGRSGEKKFAVPLDPDIIKQTASMLSVPVIANGGISSGIEAVKILKDTGVAAVMPGRGLLGNPWLIPEILQTVAHQKYTPPSLQVKKEICLEHLTLLIEFYGERDAVLKMRSILPHYFSKCLFLKDLKNNVQHVTTAREISILLRGITEDRMNIVYKRW
jgi:tRNA-dihydrouridine synthase B